MNTLHLLIGIPGCGKSTYGRKLAESTGATVVSSDGIRKELTGTEEYLYPELNNKVFSIVRSRVSQGMLRGDVVVDATNIHVRDWKTYLGLCPAGSMSRAYWFDIPPEVALRRMEGRERKVPVEVVESMWRTMQANRDKLNEYFTEDEIVVVGVND